MPRNILVYLLGNIFGACTACFRVQLLVREAIGENMARRLALTLAVCWLGIFPEVSWAEEDEAASEEATEADNPAETAETEEASVSRSDTGRYNVRLQELEGRIHDLQGKILESKSKLRLLAERVLHGVIAGSKALIEHRNEMGSSFKLVRAVFTLDGATIHSRADDSGGLDEQDEIELFNGSIMPGEHALSVSLEYRGHGYGIFSYLKGYTFRTRSSHTFTAVEGKVLRLRVVSYEKGGPTTPLEDRPDIRYVERIEALSSSSAENAEQSGAEGRNDSDDDEGAVGDK